MAGAAKGQVVDDRRDEEREARRRLALAQVRQYPDPVLRMRANEVDEYDEALATFAERMGALMQEAAGVGLAAPQIGILRRVFVYQAGGEEPVRALVNPQIVERSGETEVGDEGCLSLGAASVVVQVERPVRVTVEASSPEGEPIRIEAEGLAARVVQHEIDHLDGVVILDRTTPEQRREALAKLRPQPVLGPLASS
jgi:peptide deformylase